MWAHMCTRMCCVVCDGPVATRIEKGPNLSLLTLHPTSTASRALWVIYSYTGADETTGSLRSSSLDWLRAKQAATGPPHTHTHTHTHTRTHTHYTPCRGIYTNMKPTDAFPSTHSPSLLQTDIVHTHIDSLAGRCEHKLLGKNWKVSHGAQLWLVCNLFFSGVTKNTRSLLYIAHDTSTSLLHLCLFFFSFSRRTFILVADAPSVQNTGTAGTL